MTAKAASSIPIIDFIEDMDSFMKKSENGSVEIVMRRMEEEHQKYKIYENSLMTRRQRYRTKLPDLKNSLDLVKVLKEKKANVMLEYDIDEAHTLLETNIQGAEKGIESLGKELDTIKDQLTTAEVNIARLYNWSVQEKAKTAGKSSS